MSFEITRQLIAAAIDAMPIAFPTEWQGGKPVGAVKTTWGRWTIQQGNTNPLAIGQDMIRGVGFVTLQVFLPAHSGTAAATIAADVVATALNRKQLRDVESGTVVTFRTTGITDAGTENGWTQKNIACNFIRDTYGYTAPVAAQLYDYLATNDDGAIYITDDLAEAYVIEK